MTAKPARVSCSSITCWALSICWSTAGTPARGFFCLAPVASTRFHPDPLPLRVESGAFALDGPASWLPGVSAAGIDEGFSTQAPISLYGATKLASERLAQEYGCGIWLSGMDQPLRRPGRSGPVWHRRARNLFLLDARPFLRGVRSNISGLADKAIRSAMRFIPAIWLGWLICNYAAPPPAQLLNVCWRRGKFDVTGSTHGVVRSALRSALPHRRRLRTAIRHSLARSGFQQSHVACTAWKPQIPLDKILDEIADHADRNPDWLDTVRSMSAAPRPEPDLKLSVRRDPGPRRRRLHLSRPWSICTWNCVCTNVPHEIVVVDDGSTDRTCGHCLRTE